MRGLTLHIGITGYDENGKQIHHQEQEGNSWVTGFFGTLSYSFVGGDLGGHDMKDVGGTSRTSGYSWGTIFGAASANANGGIVVGTGSTAVAMADYALNTKIAHGTGAGQLQYGSHTINNASGTSPITWVVTRAFTNGSGGNITIAETGIQNDTTNDTLLERTVLASTYTVNNGASCVVTYTFTFSLV